jgi:predicted acetyltransferase
MTDPEIRRLGADELVGFVETAGTAFLERPKDVAKIADELRSLWDLERTWGAFDGARMVGTYRSWATEVTLPGGARLPAAAESGVSVLPTHRRRGILRAMVAAEHAAARDRGEAVGLLYAAEYPIYGRFGYGPGTQEATWTLDARAATFVEASTGSVEVVRPDETARDGMMAVFEAWRLRTTGEIQRRDYRWDFDLALRPDHWGEDWKGFLALHRDEAGALDGYVRYSRAADKWEQGQPRNIVKVDELHALTDEAYATLWRFLAEMDWVATITAERRSPGERLPWLLVNGRDVCLSDLADALWVRLLDVPRALEARAYDRAASLVLEVVDGEATGGRARWHLEAGPDGARCRVTDRTPDLTLDVSALGAAYLGGISLRDAVLTRGADEHRPGALAEADRLLRTGDVPWCSTFF